LTAPKHHNDVFIMVKLTAERIKFIVQTFLDAAHNKKFQGKWMTQIHGQNLLDCFYKPPLDCCFDGEVLVYSIGRSKWLMNAIKTTNYSDEMLKLFRNNHHPKNCPIIVGFYACGKDEKPDGRSVKNGT